MAVFFISCTPHPRLLSPNEWGPKRKPNASVYARHIHVPLSLSLFIIQDCIPMFFSVFNAKSKNSTLSYSKTCISQKKVVPLQPQRFLHYRAQSVALTY
jgi:hypothetical protein